MLFLNFIGIVVIISKDNSTVQIVLHNKHNPISVKSTNFLQQVLFRLSVRLYIIKRKVIKLL